MPENATQQSNALQASNNPKESAERLARPLIQLANAWGISTSYIDQLGTYVEITDEVLVTVLEALGVSAHTDEEIKQALADKLAEQRDLLVPPTVVKFIGNPMPTQLNVHGTDPQVTVLLEDGTPADDLVHLETKVEGESVTIINLFISDRTPTGYHTLVVKDDDREVTSTLICAPARIPVPQAVQEQHRWGWMAQMYSVRSPQSWGVGDYGDLRMLLKDAGEQSGADFMLINPIHATAPVSPLEPSPYLPESRRFLNVTYIRPQDIPEYQKLQGEDLARVQALHDQVAADNLNAAPLDINAAWDAKREALWIIFKQPRTPEREQAFEQFKQAAGEDLEGFALWALAFEAWGEPWAQDSWFAKTGKTSGEVRRLKEEHRDLFEFQCWLQWIADEQVAAAQQAAKDAGMALGLMQDMAVGVHTYGSDVWWSPERFAVGTVTVGCPPDFYNQQGQDWGQPPLNPVYLEATGYKMYREMVHNMFAHAGAIRIDHVLGIFRLWWIPAGRGPQGGAYVRYNYEAMIAVLSIEAQRADGMVIGEDLGTVPDYVSRILAEHGVLGTTVEWFARVDNSPTAGDPYADPKTYREYSLASVTTHDLPPTAGYLQYEHVKLREQLHLLSEPVDAFMASSEAEQRAMIELLKNGGWLSEAAAQDVPNHIEEVVEAMHAMLVDSPALLMQAALVDGIGETRSQNQPGTSSEYSNWRVPLADENGKVVPTGEVFANPRVRRLSAIMNRA